ncbi:MAG: response regulator transcription factor [Chlorobia bacterium]|nr:response regulator transcription factor [Fimbriimonadaceae bacterium]
MGKILVVEDNQEVAAAIRASLEDAGYEVQVARDGLRGFNAASRVAFSAIILDLMLPEMDGLEVCRRLRKAKVSTPILMLTARDAPVDRVLGLDEGADDYLGKPFDLDEFLARVRSLLRRDKVHRASVIKIADLTIDTAAKRVTRFGEEITLPAREYTLLEALAAKEGQVMSKEWIQEKVWHDESSMSNVVEVHMASLRRKIEREGEPKLIHTLNRLGYTLRLDGGVT